MNEVKLLQSLGKKIQKLSKLQDAFYCHQTFSEGFPPGKAAECGRPVTTLLGRRQEEDKFKASLGYSISFGPAWAI